jgi:ABC-type phosphate transport system auxiliary subunit
MQIQILNTIGLLSAIVGTAMVFFWGLTLQQASYSIGLQDGNEVKTKWGHITVKEARRRGEQELKKHKRLSRLGLILIMFGFLFQLWAVWAC